MPDRRGALAAGMVTSSSISSPAPATGRPARPPHRGRRPDWRRCDGGLVDLGVVVAPEHSEPELRCARPGWPRAPACSDPQRANVAVRSAWPARVRRSAARSAKRGSRAQVLDQHRCPLGIGGEQSRGHRYRHGVRAAPGEASMRPQRKSRRSAPRAWSASHRPRLARAETQPDDWPVPDGLVANPRALAPGIGQHASPRASRPPATPVPAERRRSGLIHPAGRSRCRRRVPPGWRYAILAEGAHRNRQPGASAAEREGGWPEHGR